MKNLIIVLTLLLAGIAANPANAQSSVYWEQLSDSIKKATLASNEVNINAANYYKGKFQFTDDERSNHLLKILTAKSEDENIKALYFYLFNRICAKADGAVGEVLGNYCLKMILNDPVDVLNYFASHNSIMKLYAMFLGEEFYFKEDGTSAIKYNFSDFKKLINNKIGSDTNLKKTFDDLNNEISRVMKNMN